MWKCNTATIRLNTYLNAAAGCEGKLSHLEIWNTLQQNEVFQFWASWNKCILHQHWNCNIFLYQPDSTLTGKHTNTCTWNTHQLTSSTFGNVADTATKRSMWFKFSTADVWAIFILVMTASTVAPRLMSPTTCTYTYTQSFHTLKIHFKKMNTLKIQSFQEIGSIISIYVCQKYIEKVINIKYRTPFHWQSINNLHLHKSLYAVLLIVHRPHQCIEG